MALKSVTSGSSIYKQVTDTSQNNTPSSGRSCFDYYRNVKWNSLNEVPSGVIDRFSSTSVLSDSNTVSARTIRNTEIQFPSTDRTEEDIHKHTVQLNLDENNDCEDIPDVQWRMNSDGHYEPDGKEIKTSRARKIQNDTIDIDADCVDIPDIKWNNDGTIKEEAGDIIYDLKEREKSYKIGKNGEKIFLWPQKKKR